MWHCVVRWLVTNISEDHGASIFKSCYAAHHNPSQCQEPLTQLQYITAQRSVPLNIPSSLTDSQAQLLVQFNWYQLQCDQAIWHTQQHVLTCILDVLTLSFGWDTKCSFCTPQSLRTNRDMALNWALVRTCASFPNQVSVITIPFATQIQVTETVVQQSNSQHWRIRLY